MADHSQEHHHPIDSTGTYVGILCTLLALTIVTTVVAYIDLGALSTIVALAIACTKMMLVALFFMHIRHSTRLTKLVVVGGLLWLAILLLMTMTDIWTRSWIGVPGR
jgi:cytochrome c oxidase subunit 4